MAVTTAIFDVNETLFGLEPINDAFARAGLDATSQPLWFARVLRDGFGAAAAGSFAAFADIARHHVLTLAAEAGLDDPDGAADAVIGAFEQVVPHPDVAEAFAVLADAGVRVATFTNGTATITQGMLERGGLSESVDAVLEVADAGLWKPHADAYRYALDALGVTANDATMVASHPWDVQGAMRVGLIGCWVDREGAAYPAFLPYPDVAGHDLVEVAHALTDEL